MHFNVYDRFFTVFLSTCFAAITAIFMVILQEINGTNLVNCVTITP
jgi:hypothetical protein